MFAQGNFSCQAGFQASFQNENFHDDIDSNLVEMFWLRVLNTVRRDTRPRSPCILPVTASQAFEQWSGEWTGYTERVKGLAQRWRYYNHSSPIKTISHNIDVTHHPSHSHTCLLNELILRVLPCVKIFIEKENTSGRNLCFNQSRGTAR